MNLVADIINQALDAIGSERIIGDPQEGSREAQVALRAYSQCLRQLFRAAHWNFARKQAPMQLLADATGMTADVGTIVPYPWVYEYSLPTDCIQARFVPANYVPTQSQIPTNNIQMQTNIQTAASGQSPLAGGRLRPARFLLTTDFNNLPPGQPVWETTGISPVGRLVICCNVLWAELVYTSYIPYPTMWDALFRAAFVAYLASEIALPLTKDKKFGLTLRQQQIAIATVKVLEARKRDGNEGSFNSDIGVDWMNTRGRGGGWGSEASDGANGPGYMWLGWDTSVFSGNTGAY